MRDERREARREALDLRRPVGEQRGRRDQEAGRATLSPARCSLAAPAAAPAPGSSCRGPCRRRGRRPGRGWRADAASARRPAGRAAASPSARRRDPAAPVGRDREGRRASSASHGPATTLRPVGALSATIVAWRRARRRAGASLRRRTGRPRRPPSPPRGTRRASGRVARDRPRPSGRGPGASPFDAASSCSISAAVSGSPSRLTPIWKSSSASMPRPDGGLPPTVAVTCGRGGRFARQRVGTRTMTPAALEARAHRSAAETPRRASTAAGDRSRPPRPSPSATGTLRRRAGPAGATRAAATCWRRRRIRSARGRAADAAPWPASRAASCRSPETRTAPRRPCGSRRG